MKSSLKMLLEALSPPNNCSSCDEHLHMWQAIVTYTASIKKSTAGTILSPSVCNFSPSLRQFCPMCLHLLSLSGTLPVICLHLLSLSWNWGHSTRYAYCSLIIAFRPFRHHGFMEPAYHTVTNCAWNSFFSHTCASQAYVFAVNWILLHLCEQDDNNISIENYLLLYTQTVGVQGSYYSTSVPLVGGFVGFLRGVVGFFEV